MLTLTAEQIELLKKQGYELLSAIDAYNPAMWSIVEIIYNDMHVQTFKIVDKKLNDKNNVTSLIGRMRLEHGKKSVEILSNDSSGSYPVGWKVVWLYNVFSRSYKRI